MIKLVSTIEKACIGEVFKLFVPKNFSFFSALCTRPLWSKEILERIHERKCIFVSIPKGAGLAISHTLFGGYVKGHRSIQEYQHFFPPEVFRAYFKFCIVRNPWDRVVSAFFNLKQGSWQKWDKRWAELNLHAYDDFDSFVHGWLNKENIHTWFHFIPQYEYMCLKDGTMPFDFIGCYENLKADFPYVCDQLGIKLELMRLNSSRPEHDDYKKYYTKETQRIVEQVYADDIRVLGYSFDSSRPDICKCK